MAKIRVRPETGTLYLDFFYRGTRCREQTALTDSADNRKKVQTLLNRVQKEIAQGSFDYAACFPNSLRATRFSTGAIAGATAGASHLMAASPPLPGPVRETPTFSDFAELWLLEMSPQWRRLHRIGVRDILNKNLLPAFGNQHLADITKADVLNFRVKLSALPGRKGTLTAARINKIMCFLRQILNEGADRFELTPAFRSIRPLKQKKTDVYPFTLDEVHRILAAVRADYRNYLTVRFFTGLRTCEINGLKWKHIDLERNLILVRGSVVNGVEEDDVKTESSIRDISMLPMVRHAIDAQLSSRKPDSPWVFTSPSGGVLDAHNFCNRIWYPLLRYLELDKRRPYQTRHTAATLMLASGESPEWIAKMMGHVNTMMLFRVYSRFVPNLTRQDGQAFAGLLNSRLTPTPPDIGDLALLQALPPEQLAQLIALSRKTA